jgi:hypothetical protein
MREARKIKKEEREREAYNEKYTEIRKLAKPRMKETNSIAKESQES